MLLRLPGSKGSLGIGHENKCLLEQSAGATGIQRTKFRPYARTGKQSKGRLDLFVSHKMMLCERDAVPRKIWDLIFTCVPSVLFLSWVPQTFPSHGILKGSSVYFCLYHFYPCFVSISLVPAILPLLHSHFYLLSLLPYFFSLLLLRSHMWPPSSVPLPSLHDLPFIPLFLFLCFIFPPVFYY